MNNAKHYREQLLNELTDVGEKSLENRLDIQRLAGDEPRIEKLIDVLGDKSSSAKKKIGALNQLSAISNFSSVLSQKMPDYVNVLRGLLQHDDTELRIQSYGTLASMKDEVVQEHLQTELKSDKPDSERTVPLHLAIRMLGFDEKALDRDDLMRIAEKPPTGESLEAAVRYLPADAGTYELLKHTMENDAYPIDARSLIPDKINNINPRDFLNSVDNLLRAKGAKHDLAPYLARGVGGIDQNNTGTTRMIGAPTSNVQENSLEEAIENTKALFKNMLADSPEILKKAAKTYLFNGTDND